MSKFGVMVMGPAGAGKTTFCSALLQHLQHSRRSSYYVNLDPAATSLPTEPDLDIRDLITLEDVMEELSLGPNGGLIYCLEFLLQNLDFLTGPLDTDVDESTLIVIDMPGQIELYTHVPVLPELVRAMGAGGGGGGGGAGASGGSGLEVRLCACWLMEATFVVDKAKFFAGTLAAMSAMVMVECPHLNVLSKCDLVKGLISRRELKRFGRVEIGLIDEGDEDRDAAPGPSGAVSILPPGAPSIARPPPVGSNEGNAEGEEDPAHPSNMMPGTSFKRLNRAVAQLIDDFSMVSFLQLDVQDEDSVGAILSYVDDAIQYHEAQEPREPMDEMEYDFKDPDPDV
ncbi:MAG: ATP binding protein [Chaenotheca gracillima]|nr:MAG: ATP binding protein [Chaenotheca gracillima]